MKALRYALLAAAFVLSFLLGGTVLSLAPATAEDCVVAAVPSSVLGHADITHDVQVTGTTSAVQVLLTTAPIVFDGGPVVVTFVAEYVNMLPAASTTSNSIGFDLMIDGVRMERLTMYGNHGTLNSFGPITLVDYLDSAPRIIPAGTHTVGIAVWKWAANADGYLKFSPGYQTGWGMPIRLTVSRA